MHFIRHNIDLINAFTAATKQWCVYITITNKTTLADLRLAIPNLPEEEEVLYFFLEEALYVIFNDENDARRFYDSIVGEDGPTKANSYDGETRCYASLSGHDGCVTENT